MPPEQTNDYQELLQVNESLREIVEKELELKGQATKLLQRHTNSQKADKDPEEFIYNKFPTLVSYYSRYARFIARFKTVSARYGPVPRTDEEAEARLEELLKNNSPPKSLVRRTIPLALSLLLGTGIGGYFVSRSTVPAPAPDVVSSNTAPTSSPEGEIESDSPAYARLSWGEKIRISIDDSQKLTGLATEFSERHPGLLIPSGGCEPYLHSLYRAMDGPEDPSIEEKFVNSLRKECTAEMNSSHVKLGKLKITEFSCRQVEWADKSAQCQAKSSYDNKKVSCSWLSYDYSGRIKNLNDFRVKIDPKKEKQTITLDCVDDDHKSTFAYAKVELALKSPVSRKPLYESQSDVPEPPHWSDRKPQEAKSTGTSSPSWNSPQPASPGSEQPRSFVGQPQLGQIGGPVPVKKLKLYDVRKEYRVGERYTFSFGAAEGTNPQFLSCSPQRINDIALKYDVNAGKITMIIPESARGEYNLQIECESSEGKFKSENKIIETTIFKSSPFGNSHNDD